MARYKGTEDASRATGTWRRSLPPLMAAMLATALGLGLWLFGFEQPVLGDAPSPASGSAHRSHVSVVVQRVKFDAVASRRFAAVLRPRAESPLAFEVAGRVEARLVETGDRVSAGQELARLVLTDFRLAADQADAEARAAEEARSNAIEEERRLAALHSSGVASNAAFDAARSAAAEARARAERSISKVALASNAIDHATLRASSDGVILSQALEPGQVVAVGQPVMRMAFSGALEAEVALPEVLADLPNATRAHFVPWSQPERVIEARLREVSPIADAVDHTFNARFTLSGVEGGLKLGMTGQLILAPPSDPEPLVRLPVSAIYDAGSGNGKGLWRVNEAGILEFVPVDLVDLDGREALLRADVSVDDRVVAMGAHRLAPGQIVVPVERAAE